MATMPKKKDARRGVALSDETITQIEDLIAEAVLRRDESYPRSVSAWLTRAAEEKLARDSKPAKKSARK